MPRRVSLPGASELFRRTEAPEPVQPEPVQPEPGQPGPGQPGPVQPGASAPPDEVDAAAPSSQPSAEPATETVTEAGAHTGRVRHDEKMTVYVSATELVALEQARLGLRAEHGLKVDRGRLVRAAVALALADLAERGEDSDLIHQLRTQ
ncbi:hypothetical protein [Aestuariimicrobium sp. Y1814]|uniref:hypothetical protein n=1 Tax=Aestuariimicrobium sp. Y1814 TaxID=3418742 RepID=UPI003DA71927